MYLAGSKKKCLLLSYYCHNCGTTNYVIIIYMHSPNQYRTFNLNIYYDTLFCTATIQNTSRKMWSNFVRSRAGTIKGSFYTLSYPIIFIKMRTKFEPYLAQFALFVLSVHGLVFFFCICISYSVALYWLLFTFIMPFLFTLCALR